MKVYVVSESTSWDDWRSEVVAVFETKERAETWVNSMPGTRPVGVGVVMEGTKWARSVSEEVSYIIEEFEIQ